MRFKHTTVGIITQAYQDKATLICHDGVGGGILHHVEWAYKDRMEEGEFDEEDREAIRHNLAQLGFSWSTP